MSGSNTTIEMTGDPVAAEARDARAVLRHARCACACACAYDCRRAPIRGAARASHCSTRYAPRLAIAIEPSLSSPPLRHQANTCTLYTGEEEPEVTEVTQIDDADRTRYGAFWP